jgi:uncharacterized protein with PIN domain
MHEKYDLHCPHCNSSIVKASDKEIKMRVKLIKWDRGGMFAVCKSCTVDVAVDEEFFKSIRKRFVYEIEN